MITPIEYQYWIDRHTQKIAEQDAQLQKLWKQLHVAISTLCDIEAGADEAFREARLALKQIAAIESNTNEDGDGKA